MSQKILKVGDNAPDFVVSDENGRIWCLEDLKGSKTVLYFYPKDDTPGCTQEACEFRDVYSTILDKKVKLFGISKDSQKSHDAFKAKYHLPFPLLCDIFGKMSNAYGVWAEKTMYGKPYFGIVRSTFILDEKCKILQIWQPVKVPGHAEDVLKFLSSH